MLRMLACNWDCMCSVFDSELVIKAKAKLVSRLFGLKVSAVESLANSHSELVVKLVRHVLVVGDVLRHIHSVINVGFVVKFIVASHHERNGRALDALRFFTVANLSLVRVGEFSVFNHAAEADDTFGTVNTGPVVGLGLRVEVVYEVSDLSGHFTFFVFKAPTEVELFPADVLLHHDSCLLLLVVLAISVGPDAHLFHKDGRGTGHSDLAFPVFLSELVLSFSFTVNGPVTLKDITLGSTLKSLTGEVNAVFAAILVPTTLGNSLVNNIFLSLVAFTLPFGSLNVLMGKVAGCAGLSGGLDLEESELAGGGSPKISVEVTVGSLKSVVEIALGHFEY